MEKTNNKVNNEKQITYLMLKVGFDKREVIDYVESYLKKLGFTIEEAGEIVYTDDLLALHYSNIKNEHFYPEVREYMTSGHCYGMVVSGEGDVVGDIHTLAGDKKNPLPGTFRHDIPVYFKLKFDGMRNVVHTSDSDKNAKKEIEIFHEAQARQHQRY